MDKKRCGWVKLTSKIYVDYHDNEWGKPIFDDQKLFELFSLETQAAGLSWLTILNKRDSYRKAFYGFDIQKVNTISHENILNIMQHYDVIKNKKKLEAIINNAKLFLNIQKDFKSIKDYFWNKIDNRPIYNNVTSYKDTITTSLLSDEITKELKKRGFKFIGSTTIYAFLQAAGMINDHENDCFCKKNNFYC